jgi:hypothetical protein
MNVGVLPSRRVSIALALILVSTVVSARGEESREQAPAAALAGQKSGGTGDRGGGTAANTPAAPEARKLPPDSTTKQMLDLPGRSLAFTATAGSIRLFNEKREPQADIAYTSYQLDGADRASRPVTFVFNGGPGARPGSTSPISFTSIPSAPVIVGLLPPARTCASTSSPSAATLTRSRW